MTSQKQKSFILLLSSLALVGLLTACGLRSQSPAPAPTNTATAKATPTPTPKVESTATPTKVPATPTPAPTPAPTNTVVPTEAATVTANTAEISTMTPALPALPLPDDAQNVEFTNTDLTFASPSGIKKVVEFYRQALTSEGWQEDSMLSQVLDTVASVEFTRGEEVISLILTKTGDTVEAMIDLSQAASLLPKTAQETTTASTDAPGYTINDWPVPPEATEVNKSGEKLSYKTSLKLVKIAEFYRPTFEKIGLGTSCMDSAITEQYTSVSCSVSNGDFSLSFNAFEGFDQSEVEINFTNYALGSSASAGGSESSGGSDSGQLTAEDKDGLPVPDNYTNYSGESSSYRHTVAATSPAALTLVLEFYRRELSARQWHELPSTVGATATEATLMFDNNEPSRLVLKLTQNADKGTDINLVVKLEGAAKKDGILSPAGQTRIYFGNMTEGQVVFAINQKEIKVEAQDPSQTSMKGVPFVDVPPGQYDFTMTPSGQAPVKDKLEVGPDETWALVAGPGGTLALQMY